MDSLRATLTENAPFWLAVGGLAIGAFFGAVVALTNFCTMGSISDMLAFGDSRRFRAWVLATATAVVGAAALSAAGAVDLTKSMYLGPTFDWAGSIAGGLLFGLGMVFAGGCASRNLVRAGGGDLRSALVVVLIGVSGYMTIGGLLGPARAALASATAINLGAHGFANQGLGALLARASGLDAARADLVAAAALAAALFGFCFSSARFRASPKHVASGLAVGLAAVAGWALTGLCYDEMADGAVAPASLTFVRPSGDTLEWIERFTAQRIPGFGVATVLGVLAGALVASLLTGRFRLATFSDTSDTLRNLVGATLMGIGGVVGLGCTIGQAVTGVSTLAIGSILVFVAIVVGGAIGIKTMERLA
jgi:uncharacterized membrane protein YedE/YeeE